MLGRPLWPVLDEGQDPDSLEARVAFHLHRLDLVGEPLRRCAFVPIRHVGDVTSARSPLTSRDVLELAKRLGIDDGELSRPLTEAENEEWAFYRASMRNVLGVWHRAEKLWRHAGMSSADAADILGIDRRTLYRCLSNKDAFALSFEGAQRLCIAINLGSPADLIVDLENSNSIAR